MIEIPIVGGAKNSHQAFTLQLGTNLLDFELNYISYLDTHAWSMDIYRDGSLLVAGAMLEPGCDVADSYRAGIGRFVFTGAPVTLDNLGVDNHLVWVEDVA